MVETNITIRREKRINHNPQSEELVKSLAELDCKYGGDVFYLKVEGDEGNSEHLMYLLDIYFEQKKEEQKRRQIEFYKEQKEKCLRLARKPD